jgi:DNA-binding transcriptional regulator YbjK
MGRLSIVNDSRLLDQFLHLLGRESEQCELLAQNILQERDVIKHMSLHEFVAINQTRMSILERLSGLKEEFDALVRDLSAAYSLPETGRALPDLLQRMKTSQAHAALERYERLADRVRTVQHDIAVNQLLVKNIQSFIVRALEAHRHPGPESEGYSISGARHTGGTPATLIRRKG